jgi:hypothetical protein
MVIPPPFGEPLWQLTRRVRRRLIALVTWLPAECSHVEFPEGPLDTWSGGSCGRPAVRGENLCEKHKAVAAATQHTAGNAKCTCGVPADVKHLPNCQLYGRDTAEQPATRMDPAWFDDGSGRPVHFTNAKKGGPACPHCNRYCIEHSCWQCNKYDCDEHKQ